MQVYHSLSIKEYIKDHSDQEWPSECFKVIIDPMKNQVFLIINLVVRPKISNYQRCLRYYSNLLF